MPRYHPLDRRKITREEFRERRQQLGLSVPQLAALLKCNAGTVYGWEAGRQPMGMAGAVELALRYLESVDEAQAAAFQKQRRAQRGA
jgi:DNA-binding transcriptional regulator YiaG